MGYGWCLGCYQLSSMSPKDVVFTKIFIWFVTTISDSKTVPSFEELRTKLLHQESRLHRIQAAQHSEQQSAFVSQTSAANIFQLIVPLAPTTMGNNNGRNQQQILRNQQPIRGSVRGCGLPLGWLVLHHESLKDHKQKETVIGRNRHIGNSGCCGPIETITWN